MNLYNCEKIKFSYTPSSIEELRDALQKKVDLDDLNQLNVGIFDFNALFESTDMRIPQVYRSKHGLKALFFPYRTTQGTVMVSNIQDGWYTLCYQLSKLISHGVYLFQLDEGRSADIMNAFFYMEGKESIYKERVVYSMTDPRWKFYQKGDKLWFENEHYYTNRVIRKRMNKEILTEYCGQLNLDIKSDDFWSINGETILFIRAHNRQA
ncbi:hypothetical protein CRQ39_24170 [Salmonella enterica]|nr:hypothetical protein [Salmonella enterica]